MIFRPFLANLTSFQVIFGHFKVISKEFWLFLSILGLSQALLGDFQAVFGHFDQVLSGFWSFSGDFRGIWVIIINFRPFSGTIL